MSINLTHNAMMPKASSINSVLLQRPVRLANINDKNEKGRIAMLWRDCESNMLCENHLADNMKRRCSDTVQDMHAGGASKAAGTVFVPPGTYEDGLQCTSAQYRQSLISLFVASTP